MKEEFREEFFLRLLDEDFLKLNQNLYQSNFKRRLREAISQPWLVSSSPHHFH